MHQVSFKASLAVTLALSIGLAITSHTHGATTSFTGTILAVLDDTGTGVYTGVTTGASFSGTFNYGDTAADATSIFTEPTNDERNWEFNGAPFSGSVTQGSTTTSGTEVNVNIQNDFPLTVDEAALANFIQNVITVNAGDPVDVWSASALSTGASFDAGDNLVNGLNFEIAFLKHGTPGSPPTLVSDLSYQPLAPDIFSVDLAIFIIEEADAAGNIIFTAVGTIDTVTSIVPEPASLSMFAVGGALIFARRRRVG